MTATRVLPCECCQRNSLGVDPQLVLTQVNRRSGPRELNSTQAATSRSVWTLSTTHLSATRSSRHHSFPGECHHSFPWQLLPGGGPLETHWCVLNGRRRWVREWLLPPIWRDLGAWRSALEPRLHHLLFLPRILQAQS